MTTRRSGHTEPSANATPAGLIRHVSVPQRAVTAATEALEEGIPRGVAKLHDMVATRLGIALDVARLLGMTDNVQAPVLYAASCKCAPYALVEAS